jgi:DNA polymerase
MKERFENIRKLQKNLTLGKGSWSKTMGAEFFENVPWFLENIETSPISKQSSQIIIDETKKEVQRAEPETVVNSEKVITEKEKTIKSFESFAKEKTKDTKESKFNFPGGEVSTKSEESMAHSFARKSPENVTEYLKEMYSEVTNISFVKGGESIDLSKGIKVLFVGESKVDSLEEFDEGMHWVATASDEDLLGKMIQAMKLKNGEFVRTLLIGDTDKALENICLEIEVLKPQIVISLGALATNILLGKKERLSHIHGESFSRTYKFSDQEEKAFKLIPIFHPDFLEITPTMKRAAWTDLQKVMELLD